MRNKVSSLLHLLLLGTVLLLSLSRSYGQTVQGDLIGTVRDESGSVIPDVKTTITNEATGAARVLETDQNGEFRAIGFYLGSYRVEFEKIGFKKKIVPGVRVDLVTVRRVDAVLTLGEVTETIEVTGAAPVVQTEGSTINYGLPRVALDKPVSDITRSGWAYNQLMWAPGSASGPNGSAMFAGLPGSQIDVNMEGQQQPGFSLFVPPTSMEELTVVSGAPPAEYARGGSMNVTFKSGSNELHGDYLISMANSALDAVHTPFFRGNRAPAYPFWRHNVGVGGPVFVPKVYDGRNKSFFYFNFSHPRRSFMKGETVQTLPTQRMRSGDYSNFPVKPKDPLTGVAFPNAIIPANRISSVAQRIMSDFYKAYRYTGNPDSFVNNALYPFESFNDEKRWVLKVDQNLGSKNISSFTYQGQRRTNVQSFAISAGNNWDQHRYNPLPEDRWVLANTHTFSPSLVNQLRVSVLRVINIQEAVPNTYDNTPVLGKDVLARWGIQGVPLSNLSGYPSIGITNWQGSAVVGSGSWDTRYQLAENVAIVRGGHSIKGGFAFLKFHLDSIFNPGFGGFSFDGRFTGEPFADFLLGIPANISRSVPRPTIARRGLEWGGFLQDDWRVTPKLTVSYGLRWDRFVAPYDKNRLYFNFDLASGKIVVPDQHALNNVNPAFRTDLVPVVLASSLGYPQKLTNPSDRFLPRFGFAYRPTGTGTLVIRGAYGVYNGNLRFAGLQTGGPFAVTESFPNSLVSDGSGGFTPLYSWPNAFPGAVGRAASAATGDSVATNLRPEYTQTWNFTVEKEFWNEWGLRISYLANRSTQMVYRYNANTPLLSTAPFSQSRRPFPAFQNLLRTENGGFDNYKAFQVILSHPFRNGLYLQMGYTEQRSTNDLGSSQGSFARESSPVATIEYPYDRGREKARSVFWGHHDFVFNSVYELPFGKGKRFWSDLKGRYGFGGSVLNAVVGGWSVTGVGTWHSGNFFTPTYSGADPGNILQFSGRPALIPGCNPLPRFSSLNETGEWFNRSCYKIPDNGTLGNAPINSLEGPGQWVLSSNPWKQFDLPWREGMKLQFGADIYNIFNHPVYGAPSGNIQTPNGARLVDGVFVRRGSEGNRGRKIIVSAKFIF